MNLAEDIKPISYVKAHAAEIIEKISENHRSVIITQNGEAKAVLTDIKTYQKQQDTLAMLKLIALRQKDIAENGGVPHAEVKKRVRNLLAKKLAKRP